jgi:hypothetical protein
VDSSVDLSEKETKTNESQVEGVGAQVTSIAAMEDHVLEGLEKGEKENKVLQDDGVEENGDKCTWR